MLERVGPSLPEPEMAAMRLLMAERGFEIRDRRTLLGLEAKGYVRQSAEGWSVTLSGHLEYLRALAATF